MATTTDFSKFRESGELSDLTVAVDGTDFKLHKFPLFIKSDFFRALARTNVVDKDKVELEDFPGGVSTFEQVANYCYNIRIEVNEKNVCKLRCAAEFLQMNTPSNLADATDRLLLDILTTAKLDRNIKIISDLLLQCKELGAISEQAKVVDKCIIAIIDCWLLSTKFTKHQTSDRWTDDSEAGKKLFQIPFAWFILLFTTARDKAVRPAVLADLMQSYITYTINSKMAKKDNADEGKSKTIEEKTSKSKKDKAENECTSEDDKKDSSEDKQKEQKSKKGNNTEDKTKQESKNKDKEGDEKDDDDEEEEEDQEEDEGKEEEQGDDDDNEVDESKEEEKAAEQIEEKSKMADEVKPEDGPSEEVLGEEIVKDLEIAVILDTLLGELTDNILLTDCISPIWALKVLKIAEANECKCTEQLRKLVSRVVHRLSSNELTQLSADLLAEIVSESCKDNHEGQKQMACTLVDNYLSELASKEQLTVETFNKMVDAVPAEFRFSHDTLFQVMEALLNSVNPGKEKVKLTEEQKESVLETIDYSRLTETTLRRAYDTELVPASHVTRAALALCSKLRTELEEAHNIIKTQEKDLEKTSFRSTPRYNSGNIRSSGKSKYSRDIDSLTSPRTYSRPYEPLVSSSTYHPMYTPASVPSYASELELKMALDSLERVNESHYDRDPVSYASSDAYSYRSSLGYGSSYDDRDSLMDGELMYPRSRLSYRGIHDPWPYRY